MKKRRLSFLLALALSLHLAAAANVATDISADETSVGMAVSLQVRVEGTTNAYLPETLEVDGLDIRRTGRSTMVQIVNGRMTASAIFTYTITPQREGTFDIPSFEVTVDGRKQPTPAYKLVVRPGAQQTQRPSPAMPLPSGGGGSQNQQPAPIDESKLAYAELVVPKKAIYVGEVVPVEVRFYFSDRVGFRMMQDAPQLSGEGFTVQKPSPPSQTAETIGQENYRIVTFKTSITAVKSGEMQLPKAELHGILQVPTSDTSGGMQDIFNQFFHGRMPGMTDDREVSISTDVKPIRVNALPVAGRPAGFSGAVGDFSIAATADPLKIAAGDPVTLKAAVTGRGNFDAMGDPTIQDSDGWRLYPVTSRFEKSDDIGYSGTKTFESPMVALQPQTHTPIVEFSYFDPEKEKYFTIKTQPVAVEAAANIADATPPPAGTSAQSTPTPAQNQEGEWLSRSHARSWQPIAARPAFWIFNAAAALVLVAAIAILAVRRARQGPAGRRAAIVRGRNHAASELGRENLSDEVFCSKALELLSIEAGLRGEIGPFELVRKLETEGNDVSALRAVLARGDEMKFSGGNVATRLDAEERRRIVAVLREVCR